MLIFELFDILRDANQTISFMQANNYLPASCQCTFCDRAMGIQKYSRAQDGVAWRCSNCKRISSIRTGTAYRNSNLPLYKILAIVYLSAMDVTQKNIGCALNVTEETVSSVQAKTRDAFSRELSNLDLRLGGNNCIVEIDESLVAKAKLTRNPHSRPVQQRWIFGMYDRNQKVGVIKFVDDRSAQTLLPIIQENCLPGTTIYSDGWAAYNGITSLGFQHEVVMHQHEFIVAGTDIHTNNVENFWKRCKTKLKRMNGCLPHLLPSYLDEFIWLERFGRNLHDRFANTMKAL